MWHFGIIFDSRSANIRTMCSENLMRNNFAKKMPTKLNILVCLIMLCRPFTGALNLNYHFSAGASLTPSHNGLLLSTFDRDHYKWLENSWAKAYHGAWWYSKCHLSNLNDAHHNGKQTTYADGVNWKSWKGYHESLKTTTMMFRKNPGITTSEYEHRIQIQRVEVFCFIADTSHTCASAKTHMKHFLSCFIPPLLDGVAWSQANHTKSGIFLYAYRCCIVSKI